MAHTSKPTNMQSIATQIEGIMWEVEKIANAISDDVLINTCLYAIKTRSTQLEATR